MDEKEKPTYPSYSIDQEILDARGINMTVEEVVTLPTVRYSERVHALNLAADDLAFVKCLRRRIKNRLASQNSRRRSMEHLRRLTRELRVVRKYKGSALSERHGLIQERFQLYDKCRTLREHILKNLNDNDKSSIPELPDNNALINLSESLNPAKNPTEESPKNENRIDLISNIRKRTEKTRKICAKTIFLSNQHLSASEVTTVSIKQYDDSTNNLQESLLVKQLNKPLLMRHYEDEQFSNLEQLNRSIKATFENARSLESNRISNLEHTKIKIEDEESMDSDRVLNLECENAQSIKQFEAHYVKLNRSLSIKQLNESLLVKQLGASNIGMEVLNLSVKQGRRSHGRKQVAPRRLALCNESDDYVLDLKVKKEGQ